MPSSAEDKQQRQQDRANRIAARLAQASAQRQENMKTRSSLINTAQGIPTTPDGSVDWGGVKPGQYSNAILKTVGPALGNIFGPDGQIKTDLYDIPELNISLPNVNDYVAGGSQYQNVYDQLAPSFWDTYEKSVENPMIARFSGSGTLGSPVAGVSGGAMNTLTNQRRMAENDISNKAYTAAQTPLMAAYAAESAKANTMGLEPWKAAIEEAQYPYQILPGMISGTLPPQQVDAGGGGK